MPLALFWEASKPASKVDAAGDASEALKQLIETFGRDPRHPLSPIELGKNHIFTLRGMGGGLFAEIADLIEMHGRIRVWGRD